MECFLKWFGGSVLAVALAFGLWRLANMIDASWYQDAYTDGFIKGEFDLPDHYSGLYSTIHLQGWRDGKEYAKQKEWDSKGPLESVGKDGIPRFYFRNPLCHSEMLVTYFDHKSNQWIVGRHLRIRNEIADIVEKK